MGLVGEGASVGHNGGLVTIEAKPESIRIDLGGCAVLVIDMQNDFGAKGGMFNRAGIDISPIERGANRGWFTRSSMRRGR